ncbi:MAG: DNA ligase [Spongiibacteraceae bacterium]|jgi:DNA ligase-1|nr:DNA ligase [Spongiibacteraceae bacterium]
MFTSLRWLRLSERGRVLIAALCFLFPVLAAAQPPPLQLAERYRPGVDLEQYWVSEKLDGVRAWWNGQQLLSRNGNPINAPRWFTAALPAGIPLDGELWLGRGRFDELSGIVRALQPDHQRWREVTYQLFDLPGAPGSFSERLRRLQVLVDTLDVPHVAVVAQQRVSDHATLMQLLDDTVAQGGEGLMLHLGTAPHHPGRSASLLKVKRHDDAEAVVIGYAPGRGKYAGLVGALELETPDGRRFRIGSGLTDCQRRDPPPLGSLVTYKFYGLTSRGLPRFPVFIRVRDEL